MFGKYNHSTVKIFIKSIVFRLLSVTFWHRNCLNYIKRSNFLKMKELIKKYEAAKQKATNFMQAGKLHAYFEALVEMNNYKNQLKLVRVSVN